MAENKFSCVPGCSPARETVCIDTNRVLDSCRDRDCFENARVYLSDFGNEVLEHTSSVRAKSAKIVWTCIDIEPVCRRRRGCGGIRGGQDPRSVQYGRFSESVIRFAMTRTYPKRE